MALSTIDRQLMAIEELIKKEQGKSNRKKISSIIGTGLFGTLGALSLFTGVGAPLFFLTLAGASLARQIYHTKKAKTILKNLHIEKEHYKNIKKKGVKSNAELNKNRKSKVEELTKKREKVAKQYKESSKRIGFGTAALIAGGFLASSYLGILFVPLLIGGAVSTVGGLKSKLQQTKALSAIDTNISGISTDLEIIREAQIRAIQANSSRKAKSQDNQQSKYKTKKCTTTTNNSKSQSANTTNVQPQKPVQPKTKEDSIKNKIVDQAIENMANNPTSQAENTNTSGRRR